MVAEPWSDGAAGPCGPLPKPVSVFGLACLAVMGDMETMRQVSLVHARDRLSPSSTTQPSASDTSVALKLLVVEDDSARARSLWRAWIGRGVEVVAPGLCVFECASGLRRMVVRGDLEEALPRNAVGLLLTMPVSLRAPAGLVESAWNIARDLDECWTAERHLFNAAHTKNPWLRHLGEHVQGSR